MPHVLLSIAIPVLVCLAVIVPIKYAEWRDKPKAKVVKMQHDTEELDEHEQKISN